METDPDIIPGDPAEYWRKLEEEIATWPQLPPQPECDEPPPLF